MIRTNLFAKKRGACWPLCRKLIRQIFNGSGEFSGSEDRNQSVKKAFHITTFLLAAIVAMWAQENPAGSNTRVYRQGNSWVQEVSGSLSGARNIRISTDAGSVKVIGGSQPNITYTLKKRVYNCYGEGEAQRYLNQFQITASQQGSTAVLQGECQFCGHRKHGSIDFEVVVPQGTALVSIETDGGDISVNNVAGRLESQTGGGKIEAFDIGGFIRAASGGGDIQIGKAGADVRLETGGGSIRVVSAKGRVDAQSGGGNIQLESAQAMALETGGGSINVVNSVGDVRATTGGGNIQAGSIGGRAFLETGGGSIRVNSSNGPVSAQSGGGSIELYKLRQGAQVETGSGGIIAEFISLGAASAGSHLETSAGDVVVYLADVVKAEISAAIDVGNGHAIRSDFGTIKISSDGDDIAGEFFANGSLNGGGPALRIHTSVGNIDLRKRPIAQR